MSRTTRFLRNFFASKTAAVASFFKWILSVGQWVEGVKHFVCNFVMTLSLYNCGNCGLVCRLSNMTSEKFTHNLIYYCFASLTNLCNISLLQYLSVPWPLEGGRRGISRIILHLLHHHYQKARASLAQSGPSGFIKVKVGGGYIWEFSLNVSLCASDAQLRRIKRDKHTDKLDWYCFRLSLL